MQPPLKQNLPKLKQDAQLQQGAQTDTAPKKLDIPTPELLAYIKKALGHTELQVRESAAGAISYLPPDQIPALVKYTLDLDQKLFTPQAKGETIKTAKGANNLVKIRALHSLRHCTEEDIIETVGLALQSPIGDIRKEAAFCYSYLPIESAVAKLTAIMEVNDPYTRKGAIDGVIALDIVNMPLITRALQDRLKSIRLYAWQQILQKKPELLTAHLTDTLTEDKEIVLLILDHLRQFPLADQQNYLTTTLQHDDPQIVFISLQILNQMSQDDQIAHTIITDIIKDGGLEAYLLTVIKLSINPNTIPKYLRKPKQETDITWYVHHDLGKLPPDIARSLIKEMLQHPDASLRLRTVKSIKYLSWQYASELVELALKDPEKSIRWVAVEILRDFPVAHALPLLAIAMQDKDYFARSSAVFTLGQHYLDINLPLIKKALRDPHEIVRATACKFIYHLKEEDASHLIEQVFAKDPSPKVKVAAAKAAGHLPYNFAKEIYNIYAHNSSPYIRQGLAWSLNHYPEEVAYQYYKLFLNDSSENVRIDASKALLKNPHIENIENLITNSFRDPSVAVKRNMITILAENPHIDPNLAKLIMTDENSTMITAILELINKQAN